MCGNVCAKRIDVIFDLSPDLTALACQKMMGKHSVVTTPKLDGNIQ